MATNLLLNLTNYSDVNLTNGIPYSSGGNYACNYPLDINTNFSLDVAIGSKYVTASVGDFQDLLGGDLQNNNVPVRKWLYGVNGEILEIDYIVSSTEAVLKTVSSYNVVGASFVVVDYWGSPTVEETFLQNTDGLGAASVLINTKKGPIVTNFGASQQYLFGQEPITLDIANTGQTISIIVSYKQ